MATIVMDTNIRYMDTAQAYDLWSEVYDTDGNFLQALDTIEMESLLPTLISKMYLPKPWKIVDLGCGTGRNTIALLRLVDAQIVGLDVSSKMLDVARERLELEFSNINLGTKPTLEVFDMMTTNGVPEVASDAHAVISTLVIEHVPLVKFFETTSKILRPGGLLLLTNMHAEMGNISQAGFVDPKSGAKIRPTSYAHTIEDLLKEASAHGLELVDRIEERSVNDDLAPRLGKRASKWIGVQVWFGGIFRKTFS